MYFWGKSCFFYFHFKVFFSTKWSDQTQNVVVYLIYLTAKGRLLKETERCLSFEERHSTENRF